MAVCKEKQEDFRNAIQNLKGWILELKKKGKIDAYDKDVGFHYVERAAICSGLDPHVKDRKPIQKI